MRWNNLADILREKANFHNTGITFIEGSNQEDFLSYKELYSSALATLSFLQDRGMHPKDELVFQVEDNKAFIILFWASILGGIVPVPLSIGQNDEHKQKIFNIWPVLNHPYLAISPGSLHKLIAFAQQKGLAVIGAQMTDKIIDTDKMCSVRGEPQLYDAKDTDTAFVQFSSGSTGSPKGVILSHKNLITNMDAISKAAGYTASDAMLSWMPLTHDMGMIGFHLNPLYCGMNQYLVPTQGFIRRPAIWLEKASEHKVSILCSPNFGYKYFIKHHNDTDTHDWDLSPVRILYNGAEPISIKLGLEFLDRFSTYGLKSNAMCPVYGLAEATLAVSISGLEDEMISIAVDRNTLNPGDRIVEKAGNQQAVSLVNVGRPVNDCSIRIADHKDNILANETIGHVQIKGANVTAGYYNNEEVTKQILGNDGWLKTGDMGFIRDGCLYVTGRAKDILFVNGQNFYSNDLEQLAEEIEGIELNKIAIAGFFNNESQREEVIAFVFHRGGINEFIPICLSLKKFISHKAGVELDRILPVKDIPRTTSGKLQRFKLIERLQNGEFSDVELQVRQLLNKADENAISVKKPANDDEQKILEIWKKILGTDVGIDQSFFEAGGNSLKAAEMSMMLLKEFQIELSIEALYEKPTIQELAREISTLERQPYRPVPIAGKRAYYPVSAAQKRLYYFQELNKNAVAYNTPVAFRVSGNLQRDKLTDCLKRIIARHDSLRMSFRLMGEPTFIIHDSVDFAIEEIECTPAELEEKLAGLVQPFDIAAGPLFRIRLLKTQPQEYVLFLDFHHIITDGMSVYNFVQELLNLYHGIELPELPAQYADYVLWEKETSQSGKTALQEAYWLGQLKGDLPKLELPCDFPRPSIFDTAGSKMEFLINKTTARQLTALAKENRTRLHIVMFTAYSILLSKYTGLEDILIGIPVAGRQHPDLQKMQGMFVNNLPVRSTIEADETFVQLLERQHQHITDALNNQDYPFDKLIQYTGAKHTIDRNPLFDTMFIYQNMGLPSVKDSELHISRFFFNPGFSKFDISLEIFDDGHTLHYSIEYATKLFRETTIKRLAAHFDRLMHSIIDNPGNKIADLSLITDHEYERYINAFNATQRNYPRDKTIHQLFEDQAAQTPDNIALESGNKKITYRELNDQASQLAAVLIKKGVPPGSITGILLQRSPELIISILAVLKAGGCYLPLDTNWPEERINLLIADSQCQVVITANDFNNKDWAHNTSPVQVSLGSPDSLAYIIYTSGTTGRPKGVMIEHQSLVNYCCWAAEQYIKGEKASFALFTSISFDLTVTSVFTPLITGNKIVIYEDDGRSLLIDRIIADNKVDIVKLTPSHLKIVSENKLAVPAGNSNIKRFIVGGEELTSRLAKDIYDQFGGNIDIYNEYGPTEATVGCMIHKFDPAEHHRTVPIGIPAGNALIYILDKHLRPVPEGVFGEIYISGDGIARGYLFNETLTKQKFIANPFVTGKKMYRTGDIGRRSPEGIIEFAGRYDQQVKINGYRIELLEIESLLRSHPGIEDALVVTWMDKNNERRLVAYYKSKEYLEEVIVRNYLISRLPHYMIPVHFMRLNEIPLTGNGKVDHNALPDPQTNRDEKEDQGPKNNIEALSLKIWENVLGERLLRTNDNFFELGGDSIKAVQIASQLFDNGISLPVKDILTYQTIEQISLHATIRNAQNRYEQGIIAGEKALSPIDAWFFSQYFVNPGYYNQSILLRFKRKIAVELLQKAFKVLIEQHDGLRLNYDPRKNILFYNNKHLETAFAIERYETTTEAAFIETCKRLKSSFNIARTILLKAAIIDDTVNGELLFITAHHLVIDGVSWRILLNDLHAIYLSLEKGETVAVHRKTASLIDWEKKLLDYSTSEASKTAAGYWTEVGNISFTIPQDFETDDWTIRNAHTSTGTLSKERTVFLLKEAHKIYNTDIPVLLNTALALTLKEWTGIDSLVVEQEGHGRYWDDVDTSRTIGWFTAMYPVKLVLKDDTLGNQIKAIKEQLRFVPHHGVGYGIEKYFGSQYSNMGQELAAVRLNYLGQFDKELNNDLFAYIDKATGSDSDPANRMTAKLELNAMIMDGRFRVAITYNQKAYLDTRINWLNETFFNNLNRILDHIAGEGNVHFTPSDFNAVALDQEELDSLFK